MQINFNKKIYENRQKMNRPFLAAHRGVCRANIPCNSMLAFKIAVENGADIVEIDISKSKDGKYFVFHSGMEQVFIGSKQLISEMTAEEVKNLYLLNYDGVITHYKIPMLEDVLAYLKDKVYINIDKYWTDIEGITQIIRKSGVEKQVIIKSWLEEKNIALIEKFAPDLMFMPIVKKMDSSTEKLIERKINLIGNEILFTEESDEVITDEYINWMHKKKLLIWVNTIIYNESDVISANRTDDFSLENGAKEGWGWLTDKNVDFIQTDWLLEVIGYFNNRKIVK